MLARIADSLYWTGRYMERSEHLARYLRVQYFSILDAPMLQSKEFTLRSILNMYGCEWEEDKPIRETDVLRLVGMGYETTHSLRSTIRSARENARSLRHVISTELWESINAFYVYSDKMDPNYFATRGLHEFTTEVARRCAIIRSRIDDTILHDDAWIFLKLGIHLERVSQVIRILNSKLYDIDVITEKGANLPLQQYQGTILLKVLEAFDVHRRAFQGLQNSANTMEFLVSHPGFPRSVTYNMRCIYELLTRLEGQAAKKNPVLFQAGKLYSYFRYLEYEDIAPDVIGALTRSLQKVYDLNQEIEKLYFDA